ncbi:hypothetical protein CHLRE_11g475700v5 [Chlamydomonas reinhardtii]|uniref:Uncharacterized protein n=1 Tax=Chlamydomonas reinhardtii TaxID=3055 RepID=A8JFP8_CHLRE|nr:uncharacterized protein CHLRE_11g475700v5 [Chlamydomonas reinhardtii]PNW76776.1 hypothetical protein CHLRE_11g475700v5 [Chlamydomonas reinhardtii]|eukprot:XP_001702011.1 predicted protein [Chlamydomonas reinhardtii]
MTDPEAVTHAQVAVVTKGPSIKIKELDKSKANADIQQLLKELDKDGDGTIDANELVSHLEGVVSHRRERRWMWWIIAMLTLFNLFTIGAVVGLTYATMYSLKDSEVSGSTMYAKGTTEVVRTGNADMTVVNGVMVSRTTTAADGTTTTAAINSTVVNGTLTPVNPASVLRTANYMGAPQAFSSRVNIRDLMELKYLYLKGAGVAELALQVQGVARVPADNSVHGSIVRIVTVAGTITLDDTVVVFSTEMADIFTEAGFKVARNRRMLIGVYEVLGFFNFIKDLSIFNLPSSEPVPRLPASNFLMKVKIYEPCVVASDPNNDRCVLVTGTINGSSISTSGHHRRMALDAPLMTMPDEPLLPMADSWPALAPASDVPSRRRLSTVPRSLAGVEDLAGVEVVNGTRYMTHNETAIAYNGLVRTAYQFALYPTHQRIELAKGDGMVYRWQEPVSASSASSGPAVAYCGNFTMPPALAGAFSKENLVKFEYLGNEAFGDRAARHFRMEMKQPQEPGSNQTRPNLIINYWDAPNNLVPLGFEFYSADAGMVLIKVLEFRNLTATSPEATTASLWQVPAATTCADRDRDMPMLTTPFTAAASMSDVGEIGAALPAGPLTGTATANLNATGGLRRRELSAGQSVHESARSLTAYWNNACIPQRIFTFNKDSFGGIPCSGGIGWDPAAIAARIRCSGYLSNWPMIRLDGDVGANTCDEKAFGCVTAYLDIGQMAKYDGGLWKAASYVLSEVKLGTICLTYDSQYAMLWTEVDTGTLGFIYRGYAVFQLAADKQMAFIGQLRGDFQAWEGGRWVTKNSRTFLSSVLLARYG